jgi:hypothetical protein
LNPSITSLVQAQRQRSQTPTRIQCARPFTSMLLAIDARERRVLGATVSPGVASVDTLPVVLDLSVDIQRNEKGPGLDGTPAGCSSHHVVRSSARFVVAVRASSWSRSVLIVVVSAYE